MRIGRGLQGRFTRRRPLVSVIVPAYGVEAYLGACLDSVLAQRGVRLEVVVVDDGSPDRSGEIAEEYAARDDRVRVVHIENRGLGAARNEGLRHVTGDYVAYADSDDVVPPGAYRALVGSLEATGSDFATGSIVRWEGGELTEPPWMKRLHDPARTGLRVIDHAEILGDVFAWNKLFRADFAQRIRWPSGTRYEDQPATTTAFCTGRFDVLPAVVYHWRIREDGTSITQQRASVADLRDRLATKRMALATVTATGDPGVLETFRNRVLAGDMWRYFNEVPDAPDEWWDLLVAGVREFWPDGLGRTGLLPRAQAIGTAVLEGDRNRAVELART